jgi:hypothetical protein
MVLACLRLWILIPANQLGETTDENAHRGGSGNLRMR